MHIRPVADGDFVAIAELTNHFILRTSTHFASQPVTPDELRDAWCASRQRYPWLTADADGRFAGFAKAGPWRTRAAYGWTAEAGIYMVEACRGRGLGSTLYAALIDELRRRGFHSVIGGVTLPNEASVRLHEKLGFEPCGVVKRAGFKFGAWHDVGFWQRMLREPEHRPEHAPPSPH